MTPFRPIFNTMRKITKMKNHALLVLLLLICSISNSQTLSDSSRAKLHGFLDSVQTADVYQYDTKDNLDQSMDCAKIIANPNGGFIAVYHHYSSSQPQVFLATSSDFLTWNIEVVLASNASQPAIAESVDGGYVVAWEQEPSNHLKVAYYSDLANLFTSNAAATYDIDRTLSDCAEGTPNIYYASNAEINIGFHYFQNCTVDRQARGILSNFNSWNCETLSNFDNSLLYWGVAGNIGDRDAFVYDGYDFGVIEGQYINGDFGSWRSFIFDYQTNNAEPLDIVTHNGSTAFANPTVSMMEIDERLAIVTTLFLPSEGAANGEAGELMYYRFLEDESTLEVRVIKEEANTLKIFPNPANDLIRIATNTNAPTLKYIIIDVLGIKQLEGIIEIGSCEINTSHLVSGTFFLQLEGHKTEAFEVLRNE